MKIDAECKKAYDEMHQRKGYSYLIFRYTSLPFPYRATSSKCIGIVCRIVCRFGMLSYPDYS